MDIPVDPTSGVPPYEQLRSGIAGRAADGSLPAGTRLPPVRTLATDLGLAANTVARAYKELEADGVVETLGRRGTFVLSQEPRGSRDEAREGAAAYVSVARRLGLTRAEAANLVEEVWTA
ncbi:MAG TPA: GntR family transcriptional regulator [Marmoricola sp.]|nr:GntR family transcriptional regulator [Marmoricola sp.]